MPYDRDSFLAGLAVGRTLWQPPVAEDTNLNLSRQSPPSEDADELEDDADAV